MENIDFAKTNKFKVKLPQYINIPEYCISSITRPKIGDTIKTFIISLIEPSNLNIAKEALSWYDRMKKDNEIKIELIDDNEKIFNTIIYQICTLKSVDYSTLNYNDNHNSHIKLSFVYETVKII